MSDILPRLSAALADRYVLERELGRGGMATVYRIKAILAEWAAVSGPGVIARAKPPKQSGR